MMRVTARGQVTIPANLRKKVGLLPGTEVEFALSGDRVFMRRAGTRRRGQRLVAALRGKGTVRMTTDEIMALTRGQQ